MRTNIYTNYFHFLIISRPGLRWGDFFLELDFLRGHEKLVGLGLLQLFKTHKFNLTVFFLLSTWAYFSFHNWIADSEFWPVTLAGHFDQWRQHPSLIYKGFFHLTLSWIYWFDLDSEQHLKVAKATYSLMGVGYFSLFYLLVRKHLSELHSVLVLLAVLSTSLGFSQIGVIRSDFLASLIVMLYLFFNKEEWSWKKQSAFFLLISTLLLLTTPKSIYWVAALWFYLFLNFKRTERLIFLKISTTILIIGLGVLTFIDQVYLQSQIFNSFFSAWQHNQALHQSNIKMNDFAFLSFYLFNDWAFLVLTLFMLVKSLLSKSMSLPLKSLFILICAILFLHQPRLPFFIGSYLFVLFLLLVPSLKSIGQQQRMILLLAVIVVNLSRADIRQYYFPNEIQLKTVKVISDFIESQSYSVIDGLGLFPRVKNIDLTYIGPFDPVANEIFFKKIQTTKPDFVVYTGRFLNIEPDISQVLGRHYNIVGDGYWLRKDLEKPHRFIGVLPGYFFNFRPDIYLGP